MVRFPPFYHSFVLLFPYTAVLGDISDLSRHGLPADFPLRILCIGDSITVGIGDDPNDFAVDGTHNGYRLDLYNLLTSDGLRPTFLGTQVSGKDNPQPEMEGYGGNTSSEILRHLRGDNILSLQPNLVLLHAGTNDLVWGNDGSDPASNRVDAPGRLATLIDYVLCLDPMAVVLVAMLVQDNITSWTQGVTDTFNQQIPGILGTRYMQGYKIRAVDMTSVNQLTWIHPNAQGYKDMATIWHQAIQNVPSLWWSSTSGSSARTASVVTCDIGSISFTPAIGGDVVNSGFRAKYDSPDPVSASTSGGWAAAVRLHDMDGDGVDDYVAVTTYSSIAVSLNEGQGSSNSWNWDNVDNGTVIALGYPGGTRHEVHLADMNADGRNDYVFVDDVDGSLHCYLNLGRTTHSWSWNILGEIAVGPGTGAGVRLADYDGDGKADYIYLDESGAVYVWLNSGLPGVQKQWTAVNGNSPALRGIPQRDNIVFADIDGDGRADYCYIHPDTGDLEVWYNPSWVYGGRVMSGSGRSGHDIRLARIGTSGRYDYVALDQESGSMKVWLNQCAQVVSSISAARCGTAPLPTQTTSESGPVYTPRAIVA